jgi:hypothetical protein
MKNLNPTKSRKTKSKYKINVHGGGIIYADSVIALIFKIYTKKYEKNESPSLGRRKKSRGTSPVG